MNAIARPDRSCEVRGGCELRVLFSESKPDPLSLQNLLACADCFTESPNILALSSSSAILACFCSAVGLCFAASASAFCAAARHGSTPERGMLEVRFLRDSFDASTPGRTVSLHFNLATVYKSLTFAIC